MMLTALVSTMVAGAAVAQAPARSAAQGWITQADTPASANPVVLHFRRAVDLAAKPARFPVRVTADNRFVLYVNGTRVASGPSTGDVAHWREATIDLAPWLRRGRNVVAAVVWNGVKPIVVPADATPQQRQRAEGAMLFTQTAPNFQQSVATGFRLIGDGKAAAISTERAGWRVRRDAGHGFENGWRQIIKSGLFYVAAHPETIDAARADFDWAGPDEQGTGWQDATPAPDAARRGIVADRLLPQGYAATSPGKVVRTDLAGGTAFPTRAVTVPANSKVTLLIQRDAMVAAYPQLDVDGGAGARVTLTWSEALYDANRKKGDRALVGDRSVYGIHDTFLPDGRPRTFETLWWRTWRYAEIAVETKDAPLVLKGLRAFETGYPFEQIARFTSDDPTLTRIFDVGWRTARIDAHETYMDTAYWEQLQYTGDTRLQMLISYAVSGDARLAEQAIDAFPGSNVEGGLMDGAYPQRAPNVIAPFSLIWVAMLDDWRMRQRDPAPIVRHLDRMRTVLDWFRPWQQPSGLLGKNPQWNFIDWVGQPATDRKVFPSYGSTNESCLMTVSWLGALQQGARIEAALGDPARGTAYAAKADTLKQAIRARCWVPARGLFADNPDGAVFSQHMNALAILYDVATPVEARAILDKIVAPGRGIDAPAGMTTTSYYFAWYLAQAFVHAGQGDRYLGLLDTWRDMLKLNYTTWPEERGDTRSDTHAWSAHPTADLLGIVAGIGPGEAGYRSVRIAPALGTLKRVDATAATPAGPVSVKYAITGTRLTAQITRPASLPGTFEWQGRSYPLTRATTKLTLPTQ
ncbi:hypothetical protein M9979_13630 [Sphingomonas sp. RP10(2022)]|uniref:Alpha-L-rhamnosidase n=1 Tax=Sphingomonas liriopis TaxID=2949094 RepID=A0A9X2KRR9_9SPHN|nr:alpha-L-rhamnosidase C-terminal domain-containing protein [Sphingomonas liriopis]MCP3735911.1 hypothetical protein [Sphingomonas liriopis]